MTKIDSGFISVRTGRCDRNSARRLAAADKRKVAARPLDLLLLCLALSGCQSMATDDRGSVWFRIPSDTRLVLNRPLTIPAQQAHVMLQHGRAVPAASESAVACRFEVRELGPRVIQPVTFTITGYSSQQEWVNHPHTRRYYKTIRLRSAQLPGILPMVCEYFDWPLLGRPVTQAQIEEALGDYFTFRYPDKPAQPRPSGRLDTAPER